MMTTTPAFVEEAVRIICENGKEIAWADVMAFTKFKTLPEALAYVTKKHLDVFSYYKNDLQCVTLLTKLIDFNYLQPDVTLSIIQHLLDNAKEKGLIENCARSPCWVSMEHCDVFKPIAVLIRHSRRLPSIVPYLVVLHEHDWWCSRNTVVVHTVFQDCVFFGNHQYMTVLLDCIRPPIHALSKAVSSREFQRIMHQYTAAGDACRAMAWCCRKENAGGVWYDLWVSVAERWDYRAESWECRQKRLKI